MKRAFVSLITPFDENPSDFSRVKYTRDDKSRADSFLRVLSLVRHAD